MSADYLQTSKLERSATGHTDAEVPPYGDLTGTVTTLGTWTSATTSDDANCPAQNGQVTLHVSDSSWMVVNDWIVLVGFGTFKVESKPDATHVTATYLPNSAQTPNTTPLNTLIPSGTRVVVGSYSDTTDSSAGLYYRWTDKSHDYIAGGEVDGIGVKAMYNVVRAQSSPPGTVLWVKSFGGTGNDQGKAVVINSAGEIITASTFQGSGNFGGAILSGTSISSLALCKYQADGSVGGTSWFKAYGKDSADSTTSSIGVSGMAIDSTGNTYVIGTVFGHAKFGSTTVGTDGVSSSLLVKFDSAGLPVWAVANSINHSFISIAVSSAGVFVGGTTSGSAALVGTDGNGPTLSNTLSTFSLLVKFNSAGVYQQHTQFNSSQHGINGVSATNNAVAVTGWFTANVNFGNGDRTGPSGGSYKSMFIVKMNTLLGWLWDKEFGSVSTHTVGDNVVIDSSGDVCVVGDTTARTLSLGGSPLTFPYGSTQKLFLLKRLAVDGSPVFQAKFAPDDESPSGPQYAGGLTLDSSGNAVLCGYFQIKFTSGSYSLTASGQDMFVAKLSSLGVPSWAVNGASGSNGADYAYGVACASDGSVSVIGTTSGGTFGATTLTSYGSNDAFLLKISA